MTVAGVPRRHLSERVARWSLEVEVPATEPGSGSRHLLRGWVCAPRDPDPSQRTVVAYCLAGGKCTTRYFDLHVGGHEGYSMAEHLARRGAVVVALDHPGVGASSPVDDACLLTPPVVAGAHHHAVGEVTAALAAGTLAPDLAPVQVARILAVGHSMGGMLAVVQQARHRSFDALAVLGHGGDGLPAFLTADERAVLDVVPDAPTEGSPDERYERIAALARLRAAAAEANGGPDGRRRLPPGSFFAQDVPRAVRDAFVTQQTELLHACGLTSMIPGATDPEKAAIAVPLFLAFGDQDLTGDPMGCLAKYGAATDATLFVLADSGHCHNQASRRAELWDRMWRWVKALVPRIPQPLP